MQTYFYKGDKLKHSKSVKLLFTALLFFAGLALFGCQVDQSSAKPQPQETLTPTSIGSLVQVYEFGPLAVKGYGIVAGLAGTGSSECDPRLRSVLIKYIWKQIPDKSTLDPESFIASKDTAVVEIRGLIPGQATEGQTFDVVITPLEGTQTTSLDGGRLFSADLKEISRFSSYDEYSKTLATAQGPVFINKLSDSTDKNAYVLSGGVVTSNVPVSLILQKPEYLTASNIRNRINERFGSNTAKALSPREIQLKFPAKYESQKTKFLEMIKLLQLNVDKNSQQQHLDALTEQLKTSQDKLTVEYALEAEGKSALGRLRNLLSSDDPAVLFHAARCMLSLGDSKSLGILSQIAAQNDSPYRVEAIEAIGLSAKRNDARTILNTLLKDNDFDVRFAAYKQLQRLDDVSVSQQLIASDFIVENVICGGAKTIYVSRSGIPRIVLLGSPIHCEKDLFVESDDRDLVINGQPGQKYVAVMRRHPKKSRVVGPLLCSYELTDIITTMCQTVSAHENPDVRTGLGVPYADIIELLEKIHQNGGVKAEFRAGPCPKIGVNMEKNASNDR